MKQREIPFEEKIQFLADNFKRNEIMRAIIEYPVTENNCEPWFGGKEAINSIFTENKDILEFFCDQAQERGSVLEDDYDYWCMVTGYLSIMIMSISKACRD